MNRTIALVAALAAALVWAIVAAAPRRRAGPMRRPQLSPPSAPSPISRP
ncbi:hypothetical protein ACFSTI_03250 [Rhizorhabdus histidinilytica]